MSRVNNAINESLSDRRCLFALLNAAAALLIAGKVDRIDTLEHGSSR